MKLLCKCLDDKLTSSHDAWSSLTFMHIHQEVNWLGSSNTDDTAPLMWSYMVNKDINSKLKQMSSDAWVVQISMAVQNEKHPTEKTSLSTIYQETKWMTRSNGMNWNAHIHWCSKGSEKHLWKFRT